MTASECTVVAMRTLGLAMIAAMAVTSVGSGARADVPPDPGYVELCTAARQQTPGIRCETCQRVQGRVDAACAQQMASRGWSERCQGGGATVGYALYCSAPPPAGFDPRGEARRGCGSCAVGKPQSSLLTAGVLAALATAWLARRRLAR